MFSQVHQELATFVSDASRPRRMVLLSRGHLKAQSLHTPVLTPTGFIPLGELEPGDLVIGGDGYPVHVTHTHPITEMDLYRVTFSDGRTTLCNKEHLWEVTKYGKTSVKPLSDIMEKYRTERYDPRYDREFYEYNTKVRNVVVQHTEKAYTIPPYLLGLWLGDGTSARGDITCHDDDAYILEPYGFHKVKAKYRWSCKGLMVKLRDVGVLNNKHVPISYTLGSVEQRYELLRGLMDSDGTVSKSGDQTSFSNTNERLIDGVVELVRSLGGKATKTVVNSTLPDGRPYLSWNVTVNTPECPFKLERKVRRWRKPNPHRFFSYIHSIELETTDQGRCITVANPDGLYITEDYLLTHNSTICSVGYSLWRIWLNPDVRIRVGTATKPLATAFVREVKQYLEDDELQKRVWNNRPHIKGNLIPKLDGTGRMSGRRSYGDDENFEEDATEALDKKIVWKADAIQVVRPSIMKEPTLVAASVGSPDTGFHCDLFIGDDVVTFKNSDTNTKRAQILSWVADQESVIDPYNARTRLGGESILVGTRYFYQDLYGLYSNEDLTPEELDDLKLELGENWNKDEYSLFKRNIYKNGKDESEGYTWPERFGPEVVESIKRRMLKQPNGARRFASQYLNQVYSEDDTTLNWEQVNVLAPQDITIKSDMNVVHVNMGDRVVKVRPVLAVDPAISQRLGSDYTAISVVGVTGEREVIVFDLVVERLTPTETVTRTYDLLSKYGLKVFWMDSEKLGMSLKHTFRDRWMGGDKSAYPVTIKDYRAVGDKKNRLINTLEPVINNGMFYVSVPVKNNKLLQQEISFFGQSGIHDDAIDSITMGVENAVSNSQAGMGNRPVRPVGPREKYQLATMASLSRAQQSRQRYNTIYGGFR